MPNNPNSEDGGVPPTMKGFPLRKTPMPESQCHLVAEASSPKRDSRQSQTRSQVEKDRPDKVYRTWWHLIR
jgi:hypothetical protein